MSPTDISGISFKQLSATPEDIAHTFPTDNTYEHNSIDETYIIGNVVRVATTSLPSFINASKAVSLEEKIAESNFSLNRSYEFISDLGSGFKVPLLVNINRWLQVMLIALSSLALLGYSLDVIVSHQVVRRQEQLRRLSEQNAELSARLLKSISFQGIQESVLDRGSGPANLHVADEVLIAREVQPVSTPPYKPDKHYLPLLSGY